MRKKISWNNTTGIIFDLVLQKNQLVFRANWSYFFKACFLPMWTSHMCRHSSSTFSIETTNVTNRYFITLFSMNIKMLLYAFFFVKSFVTLFTIILIFVVFMNSFFMFNSWFMVIKRFFAPFKVAFKSFFAIMNCSYMLIKSRRAIKCFSACNY